MTWWTLRETGTTVAVGIYHEPTPLPHCRSVALGVFIFSLIQLIPLVLRVRLIKILIGVLRSQSQHRDMAGDRDDGIKG